VLNKKKKIILFLLLSSFVMLEQTTYLETTPTTLTDFLTFYLPATSAYLKNVYLKEIKVGINAIDVGSDTGIVFIDTPNYSINLFNGNTPPIPISPSINAAGTELHHKYEGSPLTFMQTTSRIKCDKNIPIKVRILKRNKTPLAINYLYLRYDVEYVPMEAQPLRDINPDVFNVL